MGNITQFNIPTLFSVTQFEALSNTLANNSPIMTKNPVKTEFIAAWRTFLYPN